MSILLIVVITTQSLGMDLFDCEITLFHTFGADGEFGLAGVELAIASTAERRSCTLVPGVVFSLFTAPTASDYPRRVFLLRQRAASFRVRYSIL